MFYEVELMSRPDPLNPDEEQQLFEKLSMEKDEYTALQHLRNIVKYIVKQENGCYNAETTQDQGTSGDNASPGESTPGSGS
jgi:hypothetical protein